ncbi:hypothetical protein ACFZDK_39505 [Streptomyces sp. NPDC007901]|uniref:hypothetical protein n=1 Tax=Streptomyces sp. NPDC007901 TaxID=3364785 RepID=UPI0036E2C21D
MRRLALDDPESAPDLMERLSRDASDEVRHRAATDPWLSAAARLLTRLLRSRGTAEDAARDPALPERVVGRMAEALATAARVTA